MSEATQSRVYSLQVSGISCINCATNIKKILSGSLTDPEVGISINIMSEKVTITTLKEENVDEVMNILKTTKYLPIGQALLISGNSDN